MIRASRWASLAALTFSFAGGTVAAAGEMHWVRVDASHDAISRIVDAKNAADYGSFQWLSVDSSSLARLKSAGFPIVESEAPFALDLGGEHFDPAAGVPEFGGWNHASRSDGADFRLVQFGGPVRQSSLDALRTEGVEPVQYIHPFTYVVWSRTSALQQAARHVAARWSGDFLPAYRVQPKWRSLGAAEIDVHVSAYRNAAGVEDALRAANAKFTRRFAHIEARLAESGRTPDQSTLDEMDGFWNEARAADKK